MPNKSRRVAVKQAQLSHKKKRVAKDSSLVGDGYSGAHSADFQGDSRSSDDASPGARQSMTARSDFYTKPVGNSRPANQYVWPEMRRIGILTGIVLGILATLTFVLG